MARYRDTSGRFVSSDVAERRLEAARERVERWAAEEDEARGRAAGYRRADKVREWEERAERAADLRERAENDYLHWLSQAEPEPEPEEEEEPEEEDEGGYDEPPDDWGGGGGELEEDEDWEWEEIEVAIDYEPGD